MENKLTQEQKNSVLKWLSQEHWKQLRAMDIERLKAESWQPGYNGEAILFRNGARMILEEKGIAWERS